MTRAGSAWRLDGRVALVTGVGPGIGAHVVRTFAEHGAQVVFCARSQARVLALEESSRKEGYDVAGLVSDLARDGEPARLADSARAMFGDIDVIFNNAYANPAWLTSDGSSPRRGVPPDKGFFAYTRADWEQCFRVNVVVPYELAALLTPQMRRRGGGSIVNVLSVAAFRPTPPAVAYGVSKAAAATLTAYLAKECGPEVRVNAICPGTITPDGRVWPMFERAVASTPLARTGRAAEVANAALFLASPASSYTSGQVLYVDGGRARTVG